MSYPSVLILHTTDEPFESIEAALALSQKWKSHVDINVLSKPEAASRVATVVSGNATNDMATANDFAKTEQRLEKIRQFTESTGMSVSVAQHYTIEDDIDKLLSKPALYADIVIMSHWNSLSGGLHKHCLDMVLLQAKKPVFITARRFNRTSATLNKVAIAWHENIHSMQAIHAALPVLSLANETHLIHIKDNQNSENKHDNSDADLDAIKTYLVQRAIKVKITKAPTDGRFESHALIDTIRSVNPDLLVMGAFGHSQLREKYFHGNTYDILENVVDINLLLCHA